MGSKGGEGWWYVVGVCTGVVGENNAETQRRGIRTCKYRESRTPPFDFAPDNVEDHRKYLPGAALRVTVLVYEISVL